MRNFLVHTRDAEKAAYLWNVIAYTGSSFQSMLLMLVISRRGNMIDTAITSIAFTVASMFLLVGKYAIRNYQVSDIKNEYTYKDYLYARGITILWMVLVAAFYLAYCYIYKEYSVTKMFCMIFIMGFRFEEAVEDSLHADLQRHGRLDIAAKIWAVRTWIYIVCFAVLYYATDRILIASAGGLAVSVLFFVWMNYSVYDLFPRDREYEWVRIWGIIKNCFPPAASTMTLSYIANATKYTVDAVSSSEEQACFNIICMPVFVITLLGNYIFIPIVKRMASLWCSGQVLEVKRTVLRQIMILAVFSGVVALAGKWFGVRFLGFLYGVSLEHYEDEFVLLMAAGGAIAVFNLLIAVSTVIRRQKMLIYISLAASAVLIAGNKMILLRWGMRNMCLFYALAVISMSVLTLVLIIVYINLGGRRALNGQ